MRTSFTSTMQKNRLSHADLRATTASDARDWRFLLLRFAIAALLLSLLCACEKKPEQGPVQSKEEVEEKSQALIPQSEEESRLSACPEISSITIDPAAQCRKIGCAEGMMLRFADRSTPSDPWPQGSYLFEIEFDGKKARCESPLPFDCATASLSCDHPSVSLQKSGCDTPESPQGFSELRIEGFPKTLNLAVSVNGERVKEESYSPSYKLSQPGGAGCEPLCCRAALETILLR